MTCIFSSFRSPTPSALFRSDFAAAANLNASSANSQSQLFSPRQSTNHSAGSGAPHGREIWMSQKFVDLLVLFWLRTPNSNNQR